MPGRGSIAALLMTACIALAGGCVKRTLQITSDPVGALVWVNDREIGRTPLELEFVYYGTYDVRLVKEGYESLLTTGDAKAPVWDFVGPDFVAELLPVELESRIEWHYTLDPRPGTPEAERAGLVDRASGLRAELAADPGPAADADPDGEEEPADGITEEGPEGSPGAPGDTTE